MSLEYSNSSYDTTDPQITTPQGTEKPTVNPSNIDTVDTPKAKTAPETTDTKEEDKNQKLLNSLKTKFPGLEYLFPSKSSELLSQLKTQKVQDLLQTLDDFAKNFMDDKGINQEKLFDTRKLLYPELVNTEYDPMDIPTGIENIIETIKKLQNPKLSNFDRSILTTWIAWIQFITRMATFERSRTILNEKRINQKIHTLASKLTWKDAWKLTESDLTQINAKKNSVGNLTFEACIDDYLAGKFTVPEGATIDQIYEAREQYSIDQLSNNSRERFHTAILSSSQNNQGIKLNSFNQITDFADENNIEKVNDKTNLKSKETNGFLNRQELIISALKGSISPQKTNKILQVIGQVYYNNKSIKVDGIRWKQTNTIAKQLLEDFKNNQKFIDNGIINKLQQILKTRQKYNTSIIERSLKDRMQASVFDTQKTIVYSKKHTQENPLLKNANNPVKNTNSEYKQSQQELQATAELTKDSFKHIGDSTIDNMIPEDELIKSAWAFVDRLIKQDAIKIEDKQGEKTETENNSEAETQNYLSFPTKESAIKAVLSWEISTKELEILNKEREKSPEKAQLFNSQKELLTEALKTSAKETVVRAGADFLRNMGVQLEWTQKLITVNEEVHYYEFTSTDGIKYYYRPDTWNISTPNLSTIDHKQKNLKIWLQESYTILHHIPTYAQLTDQAQNLSFLNTQKPESSADLANIIKKGIEQNISLSVWDLETIAVKEVIQKETAKTQIAEDLQSIFGNQYLNNVTETLNPELYKTLQPLLNTLSNPNLTSKELSTLRKLTNTLSQRAKTPPPQSPNAKFQEFTHMNQLALDTPQNLLVLLSNQDELNKLADPNLRKSTNQNPEIAPQKTEFWLSILFKFLEKPIEWKWSEFNILDLQKLDPLINNLSDPNLLKNGYKNLIENIKNTYRPKIESQARARDLTDAHNALQATQKLP